ncbi:TPA: hypothetical protein ACF3V0_004692, partial [Escherichia coli]
FHTIVSIKNDGHYFCRAGGNRPDGLNEPVTAHTNDRGLITVDLFCCTGAIARQVPEAGSEVLSRVIASGREVLTRGLIAGDDVLTRE